MKHIAEAFSVMPDTRPVDLPPTELTPGIPAWHGFEHKLWSLGEQARQVINEKPALRNDPDVYSLIFSIAKNRAGMRGRQSWILLFAYKTCGAWAQELGSLLPDSDIDGHVISALYKMKAAGFSDRVLPFHDSEIKWIRKEATRYLKFDKEAEQAAS